MLRNDLKYTRYWSAHSLCRTPGILGTDHSPKDAYCDARKDSKSLIDLTTQKWEIQIWANLA